MRRIETALIALLAVLALGVAAGGFSPAGQPSIASDTGLGGGSGAPDSVPESGGSGGGGSGGGAVGGVVAAGSTGVSALFVAGFVAALCSCGVLAVLLTGDDERAPRVEDEPEDANGDVRPRIEVTYRSPDENAVVRAWERLTDAVGAETAETPDETARRAVDHGFSRGTVERLAESFSAVRYGDEPPERREREAREAREALADGDGEGEA